MVRGVRAALEHQKDGSIRYDHMRRHPFVLRGITKLRSTPSRIMQREFKGLRCPHRNDCVCHRKRGRIQRLPAFEVKHDNECRITVNNDIILMEDFDDFHAT